MSFALVAHEVRKSGEGGAGSKRRTFLMWEHLGKHRTDDCDWFMKADADSYVNLAVVAASARRSESGVGRLGGSFLCAAWSHELAEAMVLDRRPSSCGSDSHMSAITWDEAFST